MEIRPPADFQLQNNQDENRFRILIVEDDEFNQTLIRYWVQKLGYDFSLASDAHQAFELLKDQVFDLTLMDIQLPVMDGFAATQHIRTFLDPFMPIFALTADELSEKLAGAMNHGMNGLIRKPLQQQQLKTEIEAAIHTRRHARRREVTKSLDVLLGQSDLVFLKSLMQDFFSFQEKANLSVDQFLLDQSFDQITRMGHQLKSIALTIGAKDLAFYGRYLENLTSFEEKTLPYINRLVWEYDRCVEDVKAYLSEADAV